MTRAEQPTVVVPTSDHDALAADSRERAVRSLLRLPPLRRLWGAQFAGGIGDVLAVLVLVVLTLQAAITDGSFGSGYRGVAFAVAAVFGARVVATLLFGAVLLGPLTALLAPGSGRPRPAGGAKDAKSARDAKDAENADDPGAAERSAGEPAAGGSAIAPGDSRPTLDAGARQGATAPKAAKKPRPPRDGGPLDRRWTMIVTDGVRLALLIVAPLWIDWTPDRALPILLSTVFVAGVAERFWTVAKDSAAPALLPPPPPEGDAVRPLPDHLDALRRLSLRTSFFAVPAAAAVLLVATLIGNLLGTGVEWFSLHQVALASYVAAGLFAASVSTLVLLEIPEGRTPRPRSPLEGLRRPAAAVRARAAAGGEGGAPAADGTGTPDAAAAPAAADRGRTGAVPLLVLACGALAGAITSAVAVSVLDAKDLGGGPVAFALLVLALTGGTGLGIRRGPTVLPALSRNRMMVLATAVTGVALLAMGLVPDTATVLFLALLAGFAAGVAANAGHTLVELQAEERRRARFADHLQAVVRVSMAVAAVVAPLVAAAIGPHRLAGGDFVFAHGGAAFTLMLVGALLLPVAAVVLAKTDDRSGVPLRQDLLDAVRGGSEPAQASAATGFFIAVEGGDGAGKSTQVEALAEWIRGKGHEVVVTREPGATPVGKRLRTILLDVSSAGLSNRAEALLYAADRAEHIDSVVRPALERGAVVISDRYIDSSVAYQGAGRDLSPTEIARISRWATQGLVPHLTVLLDIDPATARERFTEAPDRLESEPAEFHQRVRTGFLTLAAADPARYLVVDAGREPEAVTTAVRHRLDQLLPLSEAEIKAREEARRAAIEEARRRAEEEAAREAARKAEEERLERERQEQLARLRAEEEERKRRELEEARQREIERQEEEARQRAKEERRRAEEERLERERQEQLARLRAEEEARRQAEEQARRAEEERQRAAEAERRRLAEQEAYEAEQERLRQRAAEEARQRKEDAERRLEKQRKAEEALLRAEEARRREAEEAAAASREEGVSPGDTPPSGVSPSETTLQTPVVRDPEAEPPAAEGPADAEPGTRRRPSWAAEESAPAPSPKAPSPDADAPSDEEETTTLPRFTDADAELPVSADERAAEETAVLPQYRADPADETAVLPQVRDEPERGADTSDRFPKGYFRDEAGGGESGNERTREMPQYPGGGAGDDRGTGGGRSERRRSDWAEETPLDDLPTLADELLGPHDDEDDGRGWGRGRGGRR
ncbi:dTMP kinase [Streptomyces tremellae]|uniref:Thymidylate kinase n=1 Tax=Streptomyces tremellae TaxID=1124239 RepID=A0ABP7G247_9ACTN